MLPGYLYLGDSRDIFFHDIKKLLIELSFPLYCLKKLRFNTETFDFQKPFLAHYLCTMYLPPHIISIKHT